MIWLRMYDLFVLKKPIFVSMNKQLFQTSAMLYFNYDYILIEESYSSPIETVFMLFPNLGVSNCMYNSIKALIVRIVSDDKILLCLCALSVKSRAGHDNELP